MCIRDSAKCDFNRKALRHGQWKYKQQKVAKGESGNRGRAMHLSSFNHFPRPTMLDFRSNLVAYSAFVLWHIALCCIHAFDTLWLLYTCKLSQPGHYLSTFEVCSHHVEWQAWSFNKKVKTHQCTRSHNVLPCLVTLWAFCSIKRDNNNNNNNNNDNKDSNSKINNNSNNNSKRNNNTQQLLTFKAYS